VRTSSRPARLCLASRFPLHRAALAAALRAAGDLAVVAEAEDAQAALDAATRTQPDLVVVDAALPPRGGIGVCAALKRSVPDVKVLVLARDPDALLQAVEAGADGFAPADLQLGGLLGAVREVLAGGTFVPRDLLGGLLRDLVERNREADRYLELAARLTRREWEILELLVEGCAHDAVAEILSISPQTARTHIQNIISKFGVHSRLEVVTRAVQHRLVDRGGRATGSRGAAPLR